MLTLHSNLSDTELDNKIKELEDDKISLNLTYLATHNLNGDRKYERSIPALDNLSLASSIKLEDLDEDLQDYYKEFFRASNEKIKDELKESKEEDILKARSIIADQIRGEWDADKGYTKAAADLAELKDIDTKEAQNMMLDIASEEHVHVGELETAYDAFDPKLFDELEDGHNEAEEKAEPANALDYDITEEPVAEGLDLENEEECAWCHEKFPKSDLEFEKDFGPLCHRCIQAIKSHEGEDSLKFEEASTRTHLCEVLRSISKMEIVVSILNYITGQDYSYLLEKEHSLAGTRLLPKYIIHHLDHNHENNILDNLYILNRADHQKYHKGLISFGDVEKINLGQVISEFLKDISIGTAKQLESLIESVESDQIEKINDFLNRLYELRNKSIKADGEFGIGNLVFKELRNKGYLDNLKELKHQLKSKDLSLEEFLEEAKNNNKKEVLPSVLKDVSNINITAKSPLWTIVVSPDFLKMYNSLTEADREKTTELLNKFIPNIKIDGHWPLDTDPIKEHRYPIIELKLGTNKTGQPIRILYFTKHINNIRYMIFGAILVHTEPNLSKKERELSDSSYKIFLN